jgi:hypothetical protein
MITPCSGCFAGWRLLSRLRSKVIDKKYDQTNHQEQEGLDGEATNQG